LNGFILRRLPALSGLSGLLLLLLACRPGLAGAQDFNGSWTAWICPPGVAAGPEKCSSFVLALYQKEDRLCGSHLFATVGARQIDEGGLPSLAGTIAGTSAVISVESVLSAPPVQMKVELSLEQGRLRWRRLENPPGDYLLPMSARLSRSQHASLFNPVVEQRLAAACSQLLNAEPK
jgi:hypothetical protein